MPEKFKHALVLSGGGFKGAFQVGALDYLRENHLIAPDMAFDIISGISAGSLNGAMIAARRYDLLKEIWEHIAQEGHKVVYTSDFINDDGEVVINVELIRKLFFPNYRFRIGFFKALGLLLSKRKRTAFINENLEELVEEVRHNFNRFQSLASNEPLAELLEQYLDKDRIPSHTTFTCGFVSLIDGRYYNPRHTDFASNEEFRKGVLASSAIPIVWKPVPEVRTRQQVTHQLLDGGLKNNAPLGDVVKLIEQDDDEVVYRILIINNNMGTVAPEEGPFNIAQIALRSLTEITLAEIFNNDLREFIRINHLVIQAEAQGIVLKNERGKPLKRFYYRIIQPEGQELGDTLDASPELIRLRYEAGRERAREAFAVTNDPHWPDATVL